VFLTTETSFKDRRFMACLVREALRHVGDARHPLVLVCPDVSSRREPVLDGVEQLIAAARHAGLVVPHIPTGNLFVYVGQPQALLAAVKPGRYALICHESYPFWRVSGSVFRDAAALRLFGIPPAGKTPPEIERLLREAFQQSVSLEKRHRPGPRKAVARSRVEIS
jgi:hypothetical protein